MHPPKAQAHSQWHRALESHLCRVNEGDVNVFGHRRARVVIHAAHVPANVCLPKADDAQLSAGAAVVFGDRLACTNRRKRVISGTQLQ